MEYTSHKIRVLNTLEEIPLLEWQGLIGNSFPFADYHYLRAMEQSEAVGKAAGWLPFYITVWEQEKLVGATYLYLKNNSYGEYIFDWEWARAYQAHGVPYYPKLVSAVPFTPATGPKLLGEKGLVQEILLKTALDLLKEAGNSLHYLFIPEEETPVFEAQGFEIRHSIQYHWKNQGYEHFEDFLSYFKPKKAKQILRERKQLAELGVSIKTFSGPQLTEEKAALMYGFYLSTIEKMGAIPYLNEEFFKRVFKTMGDQILFLVAERDGREIAGSLSYVKGDSLYGRYWGALEEVRGLHFELCYYRLIEKAIALGLLRFEAGAQGEHKIQRGFLPEITYSAHHIVHPEFRKAISDFIAREKTMISAWKQDLLSHSPFNPSRPGTEQ